MGGEAFKCDNLVSEKSIEFQEFIFAFIKHLGCTMDSVDENRFLVKKSGGETGISLEIAWGPWGLINTVTVHVQVNKRAILAFDDARFLKHTEDDNIHTVVASFDNPREISVLLELICKGVYFNNVALRTWHCASCETEGVEFFLQNGSVETLDEDGNTFYLVITGDRGTKGAIYDELINEYVLALCYDCFQNSGYSTE